MIIDNKMVEVWESSKLDHTQPYERVGYMQEDVARELVDYMFTIGRDYLLLRDGVVIYPDDNAW
jgi:hypothetical protein